MSAAARRRADEVVSRYDEFSLVPPVPLRRSFRIHYFALSLYFLLVEIEIFIRVLDYGSTKVSKMKYGGRWEQRDHLMELSTRCGIVYRD